MKIQLFLKDIKKMLEEKYPDRDVFIYEYGTNEVTGFLAEIEEKTGEK